jgi:DNA-binding transcriptional ArsR family regulator
VGLVHARRDGRRILYRTNAEAIRPLNEWATTFERYWKHQLNRVKELAEKTVGEGSNVEHARPDLNSTNPKPKEKK